MQVLKVRMRIEVTPFPKLRRNRVAILKSEDSFEIGTQFRNFEIAQRNFEIALIYKSRGTCIQRILTRADLLIICTIINVYFWTAQSVEQTR